MPLFFEIYQNSGGYSLRNQLKYYLYDIGIRSCNVDPDIWFDN